MRLDSFEIVNGTGHDVVLRLPGGDLVIPRSGSEVKVRTVSNLSGRIRVNGVDVPVKYVSTWMIDGLPKGSKGRRRTLVTPEVYALICRLFPHLREKVLTYTGGVVDVNGRIVVEALAI